MPAVQSTQPLPTPLVPAVPPSHAEHVSAPLSLVAPARQSAHTLKVPTVMTGKRLAAQLPTSIVASSALFAPAKELMLASAAVPRVALFTTRTVSVPCSMSAGGMVSCGGKRTRGQGQGAGLE